MLDKLQFLSVIITITATMVIPPLPGAHKYKERKITEMIVEKSPVMLLGESELRRLEPYFVKQAWNWGQLYDSWCTKNPHPGSCVGSLTRWFFYPTFSKCYAFVYGGCGGTVNRFTTEKECLKSCVPKQRPLSPPPVFEEPTLAPPPDGDALNSMLARNDNDTLKEVRRLAEPPPGPTTTGKSILTVSGSARSASAAPTASSRSTKADATASTLQTASAKAKRESDDDALRQHSFDQRGFQVADMIGRIIL